MLKENHVLPEYDVVVCGGGPAGIGAAVAAGRAGQKTLLIEFNGCLGGTATAGALPMPLGYTTGSICFEDMLRKGVTYKNAPHPRKAVGGVYELMMEYIMKEDGGSLGPARIAQTDKYPGLDRLGCHDEFVFDIEVGKRAIDQMVLDAGVEIRYYARVIDAVLEDNVVKGVYFTDKSGITYVPAKSVIDCTGDADVIDMLGYATYKGDKVTGEMTGTNLVTHIEYIDPAEMEKYLNEGNDPWFRPICAKAREEHPELDLPTGLIIFPMMQDGVFMVNGGSGTGYKDGTNGVDMTDVALVGRKRAKNLVEVLFRGYMPGAKNAHLRLTAQYPGVRETRRIISEYALTEEDLLEGRWFDDTIALAGRHFDLFRKNGGQVFSGAGKSPKLGFTPIPYRTLIPKDSFNVLAAGRCIEAEGQAMGPARIMSTCMAVGEAAGTAAAMRNEKGCSFKNLDVQALRAQLRKNGCEVDK